MLRPDAFPEGALATVDPRDDRTSWEKVTFVPEVVDGIPTSVAS